MRINYLFSEYKKNWLVCSIGIVLHVVGVLILSINEGGTGHKTLESLLLTFFFRANFQPHTSFT